MQVRYKTTRMRKLFLSEAALIRRHGTRVAGLIQDRVAVLESASNLSQVPTRPPERRHQLTQNRDEQYAVDVRHPLRLVFEPDYEHTPRNADGGVNTEAVTAIVIIEVTDYHPTRRPRR